MRINELLSRMIELNATEIHFIVGRAPAVRRFSNMIFMVEERPMQEDEIRNFITVDLHPSHLGRIEKTGFLDITYFHKEVRYSLSFTRQQRSILMVARRTECSTLDIADLGLDERISALAMERSGLVIISGPNGGGKTTTFHAMVHHINCLRASHIVIIEDPIENHHRDNLLDGVKHAIRKRPDCLFLSDMHEVELTNLAIEAALAGILVVAIMHETGVRSVLERLISLRPEEQREAHLADLSQALRGIISQKLVPKADGPGKLPLQEIFINSGRMPTLLRQRDLNEIERHIHSGENGFNKTVADLVLSGTLSGETALAGTRFGRECTVMALAGGSRDGLALGDSADAELVRECLSTLVENNATDLIISEGTPPILRIDGNLLEMEHPALNPSETREFLFNLMSGEQKKRFEDNSEADFAISIQFESFGMRRFRVSGYRQRGNVGCVIRLVGGRPPSPDELGLPEQLVELSDSKSGLLLITSSSGHGKSSTLASLIARINQTRPVHIVTIEDPVETVFPNRKAVVDQREIGSDVKSYSTGLAAALRQGPEIIVATDLPDIESISTAITAAQTGHLVIATLRSPGPHQAIQSLLEFFPTHQREHIRTQISSCLIGISSQRLIPRENGDGRRPEFELLVSKKDACPINLGKIKSGTDTVIFRRT
jgi:twitching motility protein PilT